MITRRLGPMEKSLWLIDRVCRINFVMHAGIRGPLSPESLRAALDSVQQRHPLLRVRIVRKGWSGLCYESSHVPRIPLRVVDGLEASWVAEAEYECNTLFPTEQGPLVRCVLVRHEEERSTLLVSFHHSIGDGMSGVYLIRDLLDAASGTIRGKHDRLPDLDLKEPMEAYLPPEMKAWHGWWRSGLVLCRLIGSLFQGVPARPKRDRWAFPTKRNAYIVSHQLPLTVVEPLLTRARKEGTTVHGALTAACLFAINNDLNTRKDRLFMPSADTNIRKYLSPPVHDDVGQFASACTCFCRVGESRDFWQVARDVGTALRERIHQGEPLEFSMLLEKADVLFRLFGTGTPASLLQAFMYELLASGATDLSNLGLVDMPADYDGLAVETIGFASSLSTMSSMACFAATIKNRLAWNFVGMAPVYDKRHTEKIARNAVEILKTKI